MTKLKFKAVKIFQDTWEVGTQLGEQYYVVAHVDKTGKVTPLNGEELTCQSLDFQHYVNTRFKQ